MVEHTQAKILNYKTVIQETHSRIPSKFCRQTHRSRIRYISKKFANFNEFSEIKKIRKKFVQTEKIKTLGRPFSIIIKKSTTTTEEFDAFHGFMLIKI